MNEIDEVKARLDIVDIVSETVALRKSGKSYTGFCPFHTNTKTPSFVVFPETQTWRCFGACADGGDIFSYVMKREGLDFKEALELLAQQAGVQLQAAGPQSDDEDKQRQKLLEINAAAAEYFHRQLTQSPAGAFTRQYLKERQLSAETVAMFQLGYAPDEWDALKNLMLGRGYSAAELQAAGLLVTRDDGSPGYDRFRHRLIIPIRDTQNRVIGFGARALKADQQPKYLNSPQTVLFDKSATLYGLDLAKNHIRQADQVVIVEGYMDAIQAHQHGAKNVVAQMGTALTEQQLKILKRLTNNFVLALDADTAGNSATLRGINTARESLEREVVPVPTARGLIRYESRMEANIRIATLPPGQDPDDVLKQGLSVWQDIINRSVPVVDFYFQTVIARLDLTTAKDKSEAVRELMPVLQDIGNRVEQEHYVQQLARLIHVDERTLMAELHQPATHRQPRRKQGPVAPQSAPAASAEKTIPPLKPVTGLRKTGLEEYCLSIILAHPSALATVNETLEQQKVASLTVNDFKRGDNKDIFKSAQIWTAAESPQLDMLSEMVGEPLKGNLTLISAQYHQGPPADGEKVVRALRDSILRLRLQNIDERLEELYFLQQEAITRNDFQSAREYTVMVNEHKQQRKNLEYTRDALSISGKRRAEVNL